MFPLSRFLASERGRSARLLCLPVFQFTVYHYCLCSRLIPAALVWARFSPVQYLLWPAVGKWVACCSPLSTCWCVVGCLAAFGPVAAESPSLLVLAGLVSTPARGGSPAARCILPLLLHTCEWSGERPSRFSGGLLVPVFLCLLYYLLPVFLSYVSSLRSSCTAAVSGDA